MTTYTIKQFAAAVRRTVGSELTLRQKYQDYGLVRSEPSGNSRRHVVSFGAGQSDDYPFGVSCQDDQVG